MINTPLSEEAQRNQGFLKGFGIDIKDPGVEYARTGRKPGNSPGLDFYDTGVTLVAAKPVSCVPSIGTDLGLVECWE